MPLIKLTQEALDRGKLPEPGWSPAMLNEVGEFPSSDKKSTNFTFEFLLTGGPEKNDDNNNRYQSTMFNSKAIGIDSKPVPEVIGRFKAMAAALLNIPVAELTPDTFDTEIWKGKHCWIKIVPGTDNNGKFRLEILDFAADGDVPF